MKGLFNQHTLKHMKLAQSVEVLGKQFTAMNSEGRPMTGPLVIKNDNSVCGEMKLTDDHNLVHVM